VLKTIGHSNHVDGKFRATISKYLEELSLILGPTEVCFLSQDDKARITIGMTAANKQTPFLMHMVSLSRHDWVVAEKHKLIPSFYTAVQIQPNGIRNLGAVGFRANIYCCKI
jgi:hypothetical protein